MEIARIERRLGVRASVDRAWEIVADLPGWTRWNPVETQVEGTIAFGGEIAFTETIEGLPERRNLARVTEWQPLAQLVWAENRGLWFRATRYYEIQALEETSSCIIANGMIFHGLRGEMFFDKHRGKLRHAVDAVAESWKALAEG
jgi:hypothetical protein